MEKNDSPEKRIADLTVAVATLDRPEDLTGCLEAILANNVWPAELIVVDQSPDQSARAVVEGFSGQDFPVIYVHQQRRGLSASRNAAILQASRSIIAFTDDDCAPDHGWIEAIEKAFITNPQPDAVSGSVLPLGPESTELYSVSPRESSLPVEFHGRAIPWQVGTGGNFAVKRTWFSRVGSFDERLGAGTPGKAAEDAELIFRLLGNGAHIRYEPGVLIYHKRQSKEKRMSSRWNYGYGIGALGAIWLRKFDFYILYALFVWMIGLSRELAGCLLKREWLEVRQRWLSIGGTLCGLGYGFFARQVPQ